MIYETSRSTKSIRPECERKGGMAKECETSLNNVAIMILKKSIMLGGCGGVVR